MNIGLPGVGIAGIFYLLCALTMPFKEVFLTITKSNHKFRYRLVTTQLSIAVGIVIGIIAIYKLVSYAFGFDPSFSVAMLTILISFSLLLVILTSMRLVAFYSSPHKTPLDN
jgi:uncharacterized membrane protein